MFSIPAYSVGYLKKKEFSTVWSRDIRTGINGTVTCTAALYFETYDFQTEEDGSL